MDVSEEGTEAAAATVSVGKGGGIMLPPEWKTFIADRPFLYLIRHNASGIVLFMGRLSRPARSKDAAKLAATTQGLSSLPETHLWVLRYRDGSGNEYHFWRLKKETTARYRYTPIQPRQSSSGIYSGGAPKQGTLSKAASEEILRRVRQIEAHLEAGKVLWSKGTGVFRVSTRAETRAFSLKRGVALIGWDAFLKRYRAP